MNVNDFLGKAFSRSCCLLQTRWLSHKSPGLGFCSHADYLHIHDTFTHTHSVTLMYNTECTHVHLNQPLSDTHTHRCSVYFIQFGTPHLPSHLLTEPYLVVYCSVFFLPTHSNYHVLPLRELFASTSPLRALWLITALSWLGDINEE